MESPLQSLYAFKVLLVKGGEKGPGSEGATARRVEELWAVPAAVAPAGGSTETASPGDLTQAWKGKGTFVACHPPSTAFPRSAGAWGRETCWESRQGCICRVWFATSLVALGVSLPWSQGRGHGPWCPVTQIEVGLCILEAALQLLGPELSCPSMVYSRGNCLLEAKGCF